MVQEQFSDSCSKDLSVYLMERMPKDLDELATLAEQYLVAHGKKLSYKATAVKQEDKREARGVEISQGTSIRCFNCQGLGHRAAFCPSKGDSGKRAKNGREWCIHCRSPTHDTRNCRAGQRPPFYPRSNNNAPNRNSPPLH